MMAEWTEQLLCNLAIADQTLKGEESWALFLLRVALCESGVMYTGGSS